MALGTYAQLKTGIETWMARSGDTEISANAADLVTLAEARLNRDLPLERNKVNTTLTGTGSSRLIALPSDFYEPITLWLTTFGSRDKLTLFIAGNVEVGTYNGTPEGWSVNEANIELDRPCDQAHTFVFRYRKSFALSDSATTNWLLTNHPNIYLDACLVEAEKLVKDWESMAARLALLRDDMELLKEVDARSLALAPLAVDPAIQGRGSFNINTG